MASMGKKIALVCPSSMNFMPYVENYEFILKSMHVEYDLFVWDRFGGAEGEGVVYRDAKVGHQRSFIDYCRYAHDISKNVDLERYSGVVVFGLQLAFFLQRLLVKMAGRYIVDVRDHNRVLGLFGVKRVLCNASFVVVSSPGYGDWISGVKRIVVNHNTNLLHLNALPAVVDFTGQDRVTLACIGALRDLDVNVALIDSLSNSDFVSLVFHGQGDINDKVQNYINQKKIGNVVLTGRYGRAEEAKLYRSASFVNVLRYCDGINNKTALPNRLYNAAISGRPMLALEGTYLADIIGSASLGLVVSSLDDIESRLVRYVNDFDSVEFDRSRRLFLKKVISENEDFRGRVGQFCQQ